MSKYSHFRMLFVIRLVFGAMFLIAGLLKLRNPEQFAYSIRSYHLFSTEAGEIIARSIPLLETILSIGLLTGVFVGPCAMGVLILAVIFVLLSFQGWLRGMDMDCGCFGTALAIRNPLLLLLKSVVILIGAGYLYVLYLMDASERLRVNSPHNKQSIDA